MAVWMARRCREEWRRRAWHDGMAKVAGGDGDEQLDNRLR